MAPPAKLPPHSMEAEQSVLGALMLDNRAWDKIADILTENDFYRPEHQKIFASISKLAQENSPFDLLTVAEKLKATKALSSTLEAYLYELAQNTPTAANVLAYAQIVREKSVLRRLIETGTDIAESAFQTDGREAKELLDTAERLIFQIAEQTNRGQGPQNISHLLPKAAERIDYLFHHQGQITGLATGFNDFDEMTSGLQGGDLVVIAGRPSMGKTAFGMNIAEYAALKSSHPVLVFSLEMPSEQITLRMLSSLGRVNQHKLRTGNLTDEDWPRISSAMSMLSEAKMFIDDTPALNPVELRSRARRVAREQGGLSLIVVDYLQLMTVPGFKENRAVEISEISRSLKSIAKELNVPVIALSQLNRSLESRTDKRPIMSDLRESGAIEQDADVIVFIYREEVYQEDTPKKGTAEIIIRKQRNGPIGDFVLTFLGPFTRFEILLPLPH